MTIGNGRCNNEFVNYSKNCKETMKTHACGVQKTKPLKNKRLFPNYCPSSSSSLSKYIPPDLSSLPVLNHSFFLTHVLDPVCYFIADSGLPFRIVDEDGFRNMMRKTLSALVQTKIFVKQLIGW
jgi:hypothetical protein